METQETTQTQTQSESETTTAPPATPVAPALTGKRANWTIAHSIEGTPEAPEIKFAVKGAGELKLALSTVSAQVKARAAIHGLVQRVSDAAAMARDSKTGASATPQEKYEAMKRLVEHYASGSEAWSPARSVEGVGRPRVDRDKELLSMALGVHSPQKDAQVIAQFVQKLTKPQVTALLVSEQLKEAVEVAREEMAKEQAKEAAGVDAEELLQGL